jgi:ribonuclease P protein component
MLKSSNRLSVEQFNMIMEKGRTIHSPFFYLRFIKEPDTTQISATVSKKVAKLAVERNKIRRQMYGSIKKIIKHIQNGYKIIVFAKKTNFGDSLELEKTLTELFVKAGILK